MEQTKGYIYGISGPVIKVKGSDRFQMQEMVYVGHEKLIGEVIGVTDTNAIVQVYEDTCGLKLDEEVTGTGGPLCITLGPGILSNIFDGIQRPLVDIEKHFGSFIGRGVDFSALDTDKKWNVTFTVKTGDGVKPGDVFATTPETSLIVHKIMIPNGIEGKISWLAGNGEYTVNDVIARVETDKGEKELTMCQKWPIKQERPYSERQPISRPLITGQRIMDSMFPLAKGGAAAIPGGFGTGKTMNQHQIAKWCDADIIVYIGCGERGNEMTQVLEEFSELIDPKSNNPLLDRTVLIANTSNMPVAAREASIYTGVTLAEYYRDMGYHVALMADSTSRWAEALREISGRLEEMPAEEGFPAYLASRLSAFYERAGYVTNLNGTEGSVTLIGAVSPQGGDFSEPVTQNTKRFTRCFWALDKALAYARHYPAINWLNSYSAYTDDLEAWYKKNVSPNFIKDRNEIMAILSEEASLMEIVKLIGSDVLPESQKATLEIAKIIRQGFLQQNAYHKDDTYVPLEKQLKMMEIILYLNSKFKILLDMGVPVSVVTSEGISEELIKMKYTVPNDDLSEIDRIKQRIDKMTDKIISNYKE